MGPPGSPPGLMVVAKNDTAPLVLTGQFSRREVGQAFSLVAFLLKELEGTLQRAREIRPQDRERLGLTIVSHNISTTR